MFVIGMALPEKDLYSIGLYLCILELFEDGNIMSLVIRIHSTRLYRCILEFLGDGNRKSFVSFFHL